MGVGFFGWLFVGIMIVVAAVFAVGFLLAWRAKKKGQTQPEQERITENVADLNDRFNRARYMDKDENEAHE